MAWYRNKQTGLMWDVEGELAKRLALSPEYEPAEAPRPKTGQDLDKLKKEELVELAKSRGLDPGDRTKAELIEALQAHAKGG